MGYIDPIQDITTAVYNLLDGAISVPVYKESVPETETGNYVWVRAESQSTTANKHVFLTSCIVVIEVVTVHGNTINRSVCDSIFNEITALMLPTPNTYGIDQLTEHKVYSLQLQTANYLTEEDNGKMFYSKAARFEFFVNQ